MYNDKFIRGYHPKLEVNRLTKEWNFLMSQCNLFSLVNVLTVDFVYVLCYPRQRSLHNARPSRRTRTTSVSA